MYGKRIRELRKANRMTMKQLGERMKLAESTISGYENEIRKPDMDMLVRFAELFGVTVDYILGRADHTPLSKPQPTESRETLASYNVAILGGRVEALTDEEAVHLKTSLEMFRLWKEKQSDR